MAAERLPHGYTNRTRLEGGAVEKRHRGPWRHRSAAREAAVLRAVAPWLPVPPVLDFDPEEPLLRLGIVAGVNGQELFEKGQYQEGTAAVLYACGAFLRRLATVDAAALDFLPPGAFLVHGDYGPHNLLMAPDGLTVVGIVDWEWARRGDPIEDLAWAEWIVRYHHADSTTALAALFAGYGIEPPWALRHGYMAENCRRGLSRATVRGDEKVIAAWHERLKWTLSLYA
jgi:aminoglycoside phosphotransferase (APT) family kinase protein